MRTIAFGYALGNVVGARGFRRADLWWIVLLALAKQEQAYAANGRA